jgi:hypothetical protein
MVVCILAHVADGRRFQNVAFMRYAAYAGGKMMARMIMTRTKCAAARMEVTV